ncbi:hypothetical protein [Hymenobacter cavernae]|uniref:Uncharacterized protein n=1 Tax=Hymenobacter cavernae TaxID=2044852 RepID=A0ABQ1TX03_9BACT|nr:hypothetical protein [Hymenobacter cavernae]GGF05695.1 hypothetical protein GCM10011383_16000 [Hymenobacter cavernae]
MASQLAGKAADKNYYSTKYGGQGGLVLNVSFLNKGLPGIAHLLRKRLARNA